MPSKYHKPKFTDNCFKGLSNPLINGEFIIRVNRIKAKGMLQRENDMWVPREYELEVDKKTSVYVKSENRLAVSALKDATKSLFIWLVYEIDPGKDYLWINKERYMQENFIKSVNTYRAALLDLLRYGFIVESFIKGVYWINPRLFFQGSRVNKYPDRVVSSDTEYEQDYELKAAAEPLPRLKVIKKEEQPVTAVHSHVG